MNFKSRSTDKICKEKKILQVYPMVDRSRFEMDVIKCLQIHSVYKSIFHHIDLLSKDIIEKYFT